MEYSDEEVLKIGTRCLLDTLGPIDTERFMMFLRRPGGNYTEDRKAIYDDMTMEEIIRGVNEFLLENPIEKLFHKRQIIYDDLTTEGEAPGADGIPEEGYEEPYRRPLHVHGYLPRRDVPKEDPSPQ